MSMFRSWVGSYLLWAASMRVTVYEVLCDYFYITVRLLCDV